MTTYVNWFVAAKMAELMGETATYDDAMNMIAILMRMGYEGYDVKDIDRVDWRTAIRESKESRERYRDY